MEKGIVTSFDEENEITLGDIYTVLLDLLKVNAMLQSALIATSVEPINAEETDAVEALVKISLFKVQKILDGYIDNPEAIIN